MIQTVTTTSIAGVSREARIACDECDAFTPMTDIGSLDIEMVIALAELRDSTGFVERGGGGWRQEPARDLCPKCSAREAN